MNFSTYRELGFNKILRVAGVNEIKTFHQWLWLLKKEQEIVILPLGGNAMINGDRALELDEVKRITEDVYVVIDSERKSDTATMSKDRQAFCDNCKELGITVHATIRRAIENYFQSSAVKKVRGDEIDALKPFEKFEKRWTKDS